MRVSCSGRTSVPLTIAESTWSRPHLPEIAARWLIQARVVGVGGHVGQFAALAAQHRGPQLLRLGAERVGRLSGYHVPRTLVDFRLKLAGAPAGVARVHPQRGDRGR